ncbi:hypothetical protein BDN70DRAFT_997293 [Pholiota conissans]|uniref:Odorant receptor n=1 Tax=Pholiota conissans TaxID=109636 RepID=A0A9P6CVD2_9AGAR|nr:hypothetical protein BDN70DRAFT_997293 [Pholiota conissans]
MSILLLLFALTQTLDRASSSPITNTAGDGIGFPALNQRDAQMQFGQRGINDIVISCFTTTLACILTAIHLPVPFITDNWWDRVYFRIRCVVFGLVAPEAMMATALWERQLARKIVDEYNDYITPKYQHQSSQTMSEEANDHTISDTRTPVEHIAIPRWTLTHGFMVTMGGFMLCENGRPTKILGGDEILWRIHRRWILNLGDLGREDFMQSLRNRTIDPPKLLSREDILDRSKSDEIAKAFVLLQTTWFILQCIVRWVNRIPVTQLEVFTLAYALLNGVTYWLWWDKPHSVERPIFLEAKVRQNEIAVSTDVEAGDDPVNAITNSNAQAQSRDAVETEVVDFQNIDPQALKFEEIPKETFAQFNEAYPTTAIFSNDIAFHQRRTTLRELVKGVTDAFTVQNLLQEWRALYTAMAIFRQDQFRFPAMILALCGTAFGCVHLIPGWFLQFPSGVEKWLWRASSILLTTEPLLWGLILCLTHLRLDAVASVVFIIMGVGLFVLLFSHYVITVLALISLRALPPDALQTVEWTSFIPHF